MAFVVTALSCVIAQAQEQVTPPPPMTASNVQAQAATESTPTQKVQVPVLSVTPAPSHTGNVTEITYKVIYEYGGRQYSVELPQDPGTTLSLQLPVIAPAPPTVLATVPVETVYAVPVPVPVPAIPYPYVWSVGVLYRPMPYIAGTRHLGRGAMRHNGRRGGRH